MQAFIASVQPLWEHRKFEVLVPFTAIIILIISVISFLNVTKDLPKDQDMHISDTQSSEAKPRTIMADIEGGISRPGLYEVREGTRLNDLITKAGNLSKESDHIYFQKNFNLATILKDQAKIYIPFEEKNADIKDSAQNMLDNNKALNQAAAILIRIPCRFRQLAGDWYANRKQDNTESSVFNGRRTSY